MSSSCDSLSDRKIYTAAIAIIEDPSTDLEKLTIKDTLNVLANNLGCKIQKDDKPRLKKIIKEVVNAFGDDENWPTFKASYSGPKSPKPKTKKFKFPEPIKVKSDILAPIPSGLAIELASLDPSERDELAQLCLNNKPMKEITKALTTRGITTLNGISIYKYYKTKAPFLCEVLVGATPSAAIAPASPVANEFDLASCDTRKYTIATLLKYIADQGWNEPTSKDKKTKAAICRYIQSNLGSSAKPVVSPVAALEEPEDFNNCGKSRKLTKQAILAFATSRGWNLRDDVPKEKDKKDVWCAWLKARIDESKRTSLAPPAPIACNQKSEWKTMADVEDDLTCPAGLFCDPLIKKCISGVSLPAAVEAGYSQTDIGLAGGRSVTVYGTPENLTGIKERVRQLRPAPKSMPGITRPATVAQTCGTRTSGSEAELLEDMSCADASQVCDLSAKKCIDMGSLGSNYVKFNYKGRDIVGTKEDIAAMKKSMKIDEVTPTAAIVTPIAPVAPLVAKPPSEAKAKMIFKKKGIKYDEEQQRQQAAAEAELAALFGESVEPAVGPSMDELAARKQAEKDRAIAEIAAAGAIAVAPVVQHVPIPAAIPASMPSVGESEVARLVNRLQNIRASPIGAPPVRLVRSQEALADKIALCSGVSS